MLTSQQSSAQVSCVCQKQEQPPSSAGFSPSSAACPFCRHVGRTAVSGYHVADKAMVLEDSFPVTPGHALVITRRHVARLSDITKSEARELWHLVDSSVRRISELEGVDGVTVGVNDGAAAGQTVPHVHVHIIPRRIGDVDDPKGGVRWVVPGNARYW